MKTRLIHLLFLGMLTTRAVAQDETYPLLPPDVKIHGIIQVSGNQEETRLWKNNMQTNTSAMRPEYGGMRGKAAGAEIPMASSRSRPSAGPNYSAAIRQAILIQNVGSRIIKAIEWEYPYLYRPEVDAYLSDTKRSAIRWMKHKNRIRIPPQEVAQLMVKSAVEKLSDLDQEVISGTGKRSASFVCRLAAMRITRVVYDSGPDWSVK